MTDKEQLTGGEMIAVSILMFGIVFVIYLILTVCPIWDNICELKWDYEFIKNYNLSWWKIDINIEEAKKEKTILEDQGLSCIISPINDLIYLACKKD